MVETALVALSDYKHYNITNCENTKNAGMHRKQKIDCCTFYKTTAIRKLHAKNNEGTNASPTKTVTRSLHCVYLVIRTCLKMQRRHTKRHLKNKVEKEIK